MTQQKFPLLDTIKALLVLAAILLPLIGGVVSVMVRLSVVESRVDTLRDQVIDLKLNLPVILQHPDKLKATSANVNHKA